MSLLGASETGWHVSRSLGGFFAFRSQIICSIGLILVLFAGQSSLSAENDELEFQNVVAPFLKQHCLKCHGPTKSEGELRVDTQLTLSLDDLRTKERWTEALRALQRHEMPPEKEPQPSPELVSQVTDWITRQITHVERQRKESAIVLRRLNREEYRNTIRDLVGVDFDPSGFPQDPPAGGFDNNGAALSLSPLHLELYLDAARKVFDRALVEGSKPPTIRWRFEPESGDNDSNRVNYDGQRAIVNGGNNRVERGFKVMHHNQWDRHLNARDFAMKSEGDYVIRIRAAGVVPKREQVVAAAKKFLQHRLDGQMKENPKGERWHKEAMTNDLRHFETDRIYDYGPPRLKLIQDLGGQPKTIAEFDVDASVESPRVYEVRTRFTTERAGLTIEYAYSIPRELENFWMQGHDNFARPELWVDWFEIEGPLNPTWPPESHRKLIPAAAETARGEADSLAHARKSLSRFLRRAYRRPVSPAEIDEKLALFLAAKKQGANYSQALRAPLVAALVSPHFLYLAEPNDSERSTTVKAGRPLNGFELATRLSYFIWSSMPDEELFRVADDQTLLDPAVLQKQIDRMLADPKSQALVKNFCDQWLGLREVGANPPAADLYPQYDRHLETSMIEESRNFFAELLKNDKSALNLIHSDFVVINERLARFYGIPEVKGDHFRPVKVPAGVHRGGVMTQASVLTITSNGTRTSPVKRGTWILKNLLDADPGLPVANANDIAPKVPGIDKATVRKRLEIHRQNAQCARCHNKIDPLGFALENFNAAGFWREQEGFGYKGRIQREDPKIDASSKLPDGTPIVGVQGLQKALLTREDVFLRCLASKMFTYALGRELGVADESILQAAVLHMKKNDYTLRSLIGFIATAPVFNTK